MRKTKSRIFLSDINETKKQRTQSVGTPFLDPKKRFRPSESTNSYFRSAAQSYQNTTPQSLVEAASVLNKGQIISVSNSLHLQTESLKGLKEFIMKIPSCNLEALNRIHNIISSLMPSSQSWSPTSPEILNHIADSPIGDIRYTLSEKTIHQQFPIHFSQTNKDFVIQNLSCGNNHPVLQCFLTSVSPPQCQWPNSLQIFVDDIQIKPSGRCIPFIIDISQFPHGRPIRCVVGNESDSYLLVVRNATYRSYDDIVEQIKQQTPPDDICLQELSLVCPISSELIVHPGRGVHCTHTTCFDLVEFLRRRNSFKKDLPCPVCTVPLPINHLIYSHGTKKILDSLKQKSINFFDDETHFIPDMD